MLHMSESSGNYMATSPIMNEFDCRRRTEYMSAHMVVFASFKYHPSINDTCVTEDPSKKWARGRVHHSLPQDQHAQTHTVGSTHLNRVCHLMRGTMNMRQ